MFIADRYNPRPCSLTRPVVNTSSYPLQWRGIPDVLGVFLEAGLIFDASLSVGYDTNGLLEFVKDPQKRPRNFCMASTLTMYRYQWASDSRCTQSQEHGSLSARIRGP